MAVRSQQEVASSFRRWLLFRRCNDCEMLYNDSHVRFSKTPIRDITSSPHVSPPCSIGGGGGGGSGIVLDHDHLSQGESGTRDSHEGRRGDGPRHHVVEDAAHLLEGSFVDGHDVVLVERGLVARRTVGDRRDVENVGLGNVWVGGGGGNEGAHTTRVRTGMQTESDTKRTKVVA